MKRHNEYMNILRGDYDKTPKAVYAAIALSFAMQITEGDDHPGEPREKAKRKLLAEWGVLYRNGIIPQKPL